MVRFLILFSKGEEFSRSFSTIVALGGPPFPANSRSFPAKRYLVSALSRAGISANDILSVTTALEEGYDTWIKVTEPQAAHFARKISKRRNPQL